MNTTEIGHTAERHVARYLQQSGYKVFAQNWKTKTCEIDLIAYKDNTVFFVEVKYRRTVSQGTGFDYITTSKMKRMRYGAELWVSKHNWRGQYILSAASVVGNGQVEFIEQT